MPYKDSAMRRAKDREYQRPWMRDKIKERLAKGLCKVNGCGLPHSEKSKQYCEYHRLLKRIDDRAYRARKKAKNETLNQGNSKEAT